VFYNYGFLCDVPVLWLATAMDYTDSLLVVRAILVGSNSSREKIAGMPLVGLVSRVDSTLFQVQI